MATEPTPTSRPKRSTTKSATSGTTTPKTLKARPRVTKAAARPSDVVAPMIDPEYRRALIAEAAYLRAERRNFAPGYEVDDWLNAESEVDTRLTLGMAPAAKK